jgi:hypothetical protein
MTSLELARANADALLREARMSRSHIGVPRVDRHRFIARRRRGR